MGNRVEKIGSVKNVGVLLVGTISGRSSAIFCKTSATMLRAGITNGDTGAQWRTQLAFPECLYRLPFRLLRRFVSGYLNP